MPCTAAPQRGNEVLCDFSGLGSYWAFVGISLLREEQLRMMEVGASIDKKRCLKVEIGQSNIIFRKAILYSFKMICGWGVLIHLPLLTLKGSELGGFGTIPHQAQGHSPVQ